MDNKRIATGYDVELQLQPDIIKRSIIDSILKDVLCTNEIVKKYELSLDVAKGTFDSDGLNPVFKYPFTCQYQGIKGLSCTLQITLSCEENENGSWSIKPKLGADILGSIIDITTLSDKIKIPSLPLPFSGLTDVDIITVPASDGYDDAIVLLANIDFAKLLDIETEITRTDTECDKSNAQSFLPKGADYIIGINKSIYGQISESSRISAKEAIAKEIEYLTKEIKNIELQKEKEKEKFLKEKLKDKKEELKTEKKHLERIKIKKASTSTSKDTLKITIHGKYDIPKTDQLDLSFKVIVSIKFSIEKNGLLHAQCDVETKYNNNAWYTVLGSALGAVVWGPIGWIVGLHTNSIFKKATSEIRSEMSEKVKLMVLSPQDYHYCSQDGVIKLHLQNGIINKLNCILREPIALKQLFDAFFYTAQFAITLKTTSVFFDDNGATIWGRFNRLEEHLICEDVILKQIKYYNDGRTPTLVYKKNNDQEQKELNFDEALEFIKTTERAEVNIIDKIDSEDQNYRNATGKLPMNYLQKPEAVYKRNNVIIAYKFDDKLIAKKEELIELYINRVVFIKGVYIATRKGKKYFTTFRDDNAANNLSSLPSISKEDMDSIYYDD